MKFHPIAAGLLTVFSSLALAQSTLTISAADLAKLNAKAPVTTTMSVTVTVSPPVVTPPVVTPPVTVPPITTAGADWVFNKGVFNWAGDWDSGGNANYASAIVGVDGKSKSIALPGAYGFEYWLPYPKMNSAGPASNGVNYNLAGKTKMTIAIRPTKAGLSATIGFYRASGTTDDIAFGNTINIVSAKYGCTTLTVLAWNVCTIPLIDFGLGSQTWIYKFIVQQQGATPQPWNIDQVGFLP